MLGQPNQAAQYIEPNLGEDHLEFINNPKYERTRLAIIRNPESLEIFSNIQGREQFSGAAAKNYDYNSIFSLLNDQNCSPITDLIAQNIADNADNPKKVRQILGGLQQYTKDHIYYLRHNYKSAIAINLMQNPEIIGLFAMFEKHHIALFRNENKQELSLKISRDPHLAELFVYINPERIKNLSNNSPILLLCLYDYYGETWGRSLQKHHLDFLNNPKNEELIFLMHKNREMLAILTRLQEYHLDLIESLDTTNQIVLETINQPKLVDWVIELKDYHVNFLMQQDLETVFPILKESGRRNWFQDLTEENIKNLGDLDGQIISAIIKNHLNRINFPQLRSHHFELVSNHNTRKYNH